MVQLNINNKEVVKFTNKLEKLHRSALPVAIRKTLNDAAFDVKQNTLLKSAENTFEKRSDNFFKAHSKVEGAKGFDVSKMEATIGMVSKGLKGKNNYAVKNLEQQEEGGTIKSKSFIPKDEAREGSSYESPVIPLNRLSKIKNVINAELVNNVNKKQRYIRAAIMAKKVFRNKAFILGNIWKNRQTLSRIDKVTFSSDGVKIERTPVYTYQRGRSISVRGTRFMQRAAHESGMKIDDYYVINAQKQIERLMK